MLQDMSTFDGDIRQAEPPIFVIEAFGQETLTDEHQGRISQTIIRGPRQTRKLTKRRTKGSMQLSNSLKMWNSKKLQRELQDDDEYQGLVLCMDRFGYFSTLPSPAPSLVDVRDIQDFAYERSRTPMCELA